MDKMVFSELVNIASLKSMAENLYEASGIPIGIVGVDGTIHVQTGWQDICKKFHRQNPHTCSCCLESDRYIVENLQQDSFIEYKCLNNMWDIAVPFMIRGEHLATIFLGQFFYEDEEIDREFFRTQAVNFGFDETEYLEALDRVPRFSRKKVRNIIEYYLELVKTLAESSLRQHEYEKAQQELSINQKYLDTLYNAVNDSIFIHDFNGKIIDVNQTTIAAFGYTRNELIHMNIDDIISGSSPLKGMELSESIQRTKYMNPVIIECICVDKNGKEFWGEVNISAIKLGEIEEVIATVRDITDRKRNELALHKEAQEMETLRTEFFANISHELRTPLNIIFGALQLIELEAEKKDIFIDRKRLSNNLGIGKQNCYRLLRLINNLIDSTKLDAGYYELSLANCNIVGIVEDITLSVAEYIHSKNLSLTFDTDVEEKIIACDLDKLERIMLNLLSNAVKFTPAGGNIFVNIADGAEYVTITVEDTGIGIPDSKQNIIFDRFRQVDKSLARSFEGSGIGLSLVKSIVEMHGGSISVQSSLGQGTKFLIQLPVRVIDGVDSAEACCTDDAMGKYIERIKVEFSDIYK